MLMDKDQVHVPDDTKVIEDAGQLMISALKNILTDKHKHEEGGPVVNPQNVDPSKP